MLIQFYYFSVRLSIKSSSILYKGLKNSEISIIFIASAIKVEIVIFIYKRWCVVMVYVKNNPSMYLIVETH